MTKGDRIKSRREQLGLTQTQLAHMIGSTKQNVYKYENNIISNIPSDKIEAIAKALKTAPGYIMGWNTVIQDFTAAGFRIEDLANELNLPPNIVKEIFSDIDSLDIETASKIIQVARVLLTQKEKSDKDFQRIEKAYNHMPKDKKRQMLKILEASMSEYFCDDGGD